MDGDVFGLGDQGPDISGALFEGELDPPSCDLMEFMIFTIEENIIKILGLKKRQEPLCENGVPASFIIGNMACITRTGLFWQHS